MSIKHRFKIEEKRLANQKIIQVTHHTDESTFFSIFPKYGAAIHKLVIRGQNILETSEDLVTFTERTVNAYAGAQLFPYPNRIKDGEYIFLGKRYCFPTNDPIGNNSLHGFVNDKKFEIVKLDEENGIIETVYNYHGDEIGYPFNFKLANTYRLLDNGIQITSNITNNENFPIPFGHGWHPYFTIGEDIAAAKLQIAASNHYPFDEDFIPLGHLESNNLFLQPREIADIELNHCFQIDIGEIVLARLYFPEKKLMLKLVSEDYHFLQVYTPPKRASIALEPQTCIANAFNNEIGLLKLPANETQSLSVKLLIDNETLV